MLEANQGDTILAPVFEVDPLWPRPLPNHWILGSTIGVGVDSRDHVFIIHRGDSTLNQRTEAGTKSNPPIAECCAAAPPILEFDPEGNLIKGWGGRARATIGRSPIMASPSTTRTTCGSAGNGGTASSALKDSHILKFTHDGKFLMQIGKANEAANSNSLEHFGRVAKIAFDPAANEAFVADGYGNKRVAVLDMDTGKIKRYWGAYGHKPDDTNLGPYNPDAPLAQQFRNPVHCAQPTNDGLVYVCDRPNDRIQVFRKDGTFVKEQRIAPRTRGTGRSGTSPSLATRTRNTCSSPTGRTSGST